MSPLIVHLHRSNTYFKLDAGSGLALINSPLIHQKTTLVSQLVENDLQQCRFNGAPYSSVGCAGVPFAEATVEFKS